LNGKGLLKLMLMPMGFSMLKSFLMPMRILMG
jgi:hypothetical protein